MERQEGGKHKTITKHKRYEEDITPFKKEGREAEFYSLYKPCYTTVIEDNCLLNGGIDELWDVFSGTSTYHFDNTGSFLGIGDSTTAATATQTALVGTQTDYQAMEATYPTSATQKITFKGSWGSTQGNFAWNEWAVKQTGSGKLLNRKVEALGTKSGGTWTLEVDVTLS